MLPFIPHVWRIKRSLDATLAAGDGLLAYTLEADVRSTTFSVSSAWSDEASFRAWVGSDDHVRAMRSLSDHVGGDATFDIEHRTASDDVVDSVEYPTGG